MCLLQVNELLLTPVQVLLELNVSAKVFLLLLLARCLSRLLGYGHRQTFAHDPLLLNRNVLLKTYANQGSFEELIRSGKKLSLDNFFLNIDNFIIFGPLFALDIYYAKKRTCLSYTYIHFKYLLFNLLDLFIDRNFSLYAHTIFYEMISIIN